MDKITGKISITQGLGGSLSPVLGIGGSFSVPLQVPRDPYSGEYEITPGDEDIILNTSGKDLRENIIVKKVPSNYGKIIWNGSFMRIV